MPDWTTYTADQWAAFTADEWAAFTTDSGDTTAPTLTAASINAAGTTLSLTFSEAVTGVSAADFALTGGHALSAATGSGTSWSMTVGTVYVNDVVTLSYTGTAVQDGSGNLLATFSGQAVTNNSTQSTSPSGGIFLQTATGAIYLTT